MNQLNLLISGAIAAAALVVTLFFLRFWRSTGDRFFLYFAVSFALEAITRTLLALSHDQGEQTPVFYLLRLVAYALILLAIIGKNRRRPPVEAPPRIGS